MESTENRNEENSINLYKAVSVIKDFSRFILKRFYILGLFIALGAFYMGYRTYVQKPIWSAKLNFMLNDEGGSSGISVGSLLSSFGLPGGGSGDMNLQKIIELMKSRKIVSNALLKKVKLGSKDQPDYLANYFLKIYDIHELWKEQERENLYDFWFVSDTLAQDDERANTVMQMIKGMVTNEMLITEITPGENINMIIRSENEAFSLQLCLSLFEELKNYYKEGQTKKSKQTFDLIVERTDSLRGALQIAEGKLARFEDQNRGLYANTPLLARDRLERDVNLLQGVYLEAARNLESARFNLQNSEPIMRAIDLPVFPLGFKKDKLIPSVIQGGILGLFGGLFFMGLGLFFARRYKQERIAYEEQSALMQS